MRQHGVDPRHAPQRQWACAWPASERAELQAAACVLWPEARDAALPGTWLLLWPGYWCLALAPEHGELPDPGLLLAFGVGAYLMRGAG